MPRANTTNQSPASSQPRSSTTTARMPNSTAGTGSQMTAPTPTQRQPGRAKGSVGYSAADCMALVSAVKAILPLGAQEWINVQEHYNQYVTENNRVTRDPNPLKYKFRALATHSKPTGDPECPSYVREAKLTQKAMDSRAHVIACHDSDSDKEDGAGAPVPMSLETEEVSPGNEDSQLPNKNHNQSDIDVKGLPSPNLNHNNDNSNEGDPPNSASHSAFSAWSQTQHSSQAGPHRPVSSSRVSPYSPLKAGARSTQARQASLGLGDQLSAYFDLIARQKRNMENGMSQFYVIQLKDANKTIQGLREEVNQMRMGDEEKRREADAKIWALNLENQALKGKIDLLQMRLDMYNTASMFHSQPVRLGAAPYRGPPVDNANNVLGETSTPQLSNPINNPVNNITAQHSAHQDQGSDNQLPS